MTAAAAQTATVRVPAMVEPASLSDMREGMIAEEIVIAQRGGVRLDRRDAERLIMSDLTITDAVEREAPAQWTAPDSSSDDGKGTPLPVDPIVKERLAAELAKSGTSVVDPDAGWSVRESKVLHAKSMPDDDWSRAKMRVARILAGRTEDPDIRIACSTCEAPGLALEIVAIHAFIVTSQPGRHTGMWRPERPGDQPNPFHGLKPDDFGRKFKRLIEDICDRSTGIPGLGPWRVPK